MSKITYVKIAGRNYPMSFSLGASKKIIEKYGSAEKMKKELGGGNDSQKIDMVTDMLALLISQGCAYKNYFEKDMPAEEDAPIIDGKWTPITKDILEIAVNVEDIGMLKEKIEECIGTGSRKDVELRTDGKNTKGGQG